MDTKQFDRIATTFASPYGRRNVLRLLGAATFGAGGLSLLNVADGEARKRRKKKKKKKEQPEDPQDPQPEQPQLFPDIAITAILLEPTSEVNHDNVVVQFTNVGTQLASGFRIGMFATRAGGQVRKEEFSAPLTLGPGVSGVEKFRLGCSWINMGTVTARTDTTPIPGEPSNKTADNLLAVAFANVCS